MAIGFSSAAGNRGSRRRDLAAAALVGISAMVGNAAADRRTPSGPVTVGEVTAAAAAGKSRLTNITELLRHDVESEVAAINWAKLGIRRRYTISAALVRLES